MATESIPRRSRSPHRGIDSAYGAKDDFEGTSSSYRARSPGFTDRRRSGRDRSRSPPPNIDRYAPGRRDKYSTRRDSGRYNRSPPPATANIDRYVPGQDPPPPIVNPLPDPLTIDFQVGFNWFAEWWRKDQEVKEDRERQKTGARKPIERMKGEKEAREDREKQRAQIQAAYDAYKEKLQVQLARQFVKQHKDQEWFKERYDPQIAEPFRQRLATVRRTTFAQWERDLEAGVFDDFTLEGIYKSESNGAGGVQEREEGEAPAAAEVLGVGDLVPAKGGDLRDDAANLPALLIKTIAPHVSRDKLEEFCKEHLGEGDAGFRWLSLSDPNPLKKCHRIGWVLLNPSDEQPSVPANGARGDGREDEDEDGEAEDEHAGNGTTQSTAERAQERINGKSIADEEKGSFQCHVGVHVPSNQPRKKALWDLFSAPERIERDLQLAMRLVSKLEQELGEDIDAVNKIEERVEDLRSKGLLAAVNGVTKPAAEPREEGEDDDMEDGVLDEEVDDEDLLAKKKKLDLLVEYLRRVFNFCFFCVFECDSVHELTRKCPGGHLRRPRESLTSAAKEAAKASAYGEEFPLKRHGDGDDDVEEDSPAAERQRFNKNNKVHLQLQRGFNWVKTYEDKLFQILEPESADLAKLGGRPVEEALEDLLKSFVKQEDEAKFRCKISSDCTKLFRGLGFWKKHVEKRHGDWFDELKKELELVNRYVLDPAHIAPGRTDATSNGHFTAGGAMSNGTPRGFSLNGAMPFVNPAVAGGLAPFSLSGSFAGGAMALDGAGPMRRAAGGRFGSRAGPYDRQGGRPGGRPGMGPRPGGRFADAAGSAAPREAVAGRSLKSYEDLDAADGGTAALDY